MPAIGMPGMLTVGAEAVGDDEVVVVAAAPGMVAACAWPRPRKPAAAATAVAATTPPRAINAEFMREILPCPHVATDVTECSFAITLSVSLGD